MKKPLLQMGIITLMVLSVTARSKCQNSLPEVFRQETITEQINYIEERTRIYENYRAIREDMFQTLSSNIIDTLDNSRSRISSLMFQTTLLDSRIDSLIKILETSNNELREMTRTKNSIRLLGMEVNKILYNSVMWIIIAVLIFLLVSGFMVFRQSRTTTLSAKKELNDLKEEFEAYRTKTRLEREKTALSHFNEIKKLKGR